MKYLIASFFLLLASVSFGQDVNKRTTRSGEMNTLMGESNSFGGFLGLGTRMTELNGQSALMTGAEIQAVFGHKLNIGFAGYGLLSDVYGVNVDDENRTLYYDMGYGGMIVEPVFFSKSLIHITTPLFFGAGGIGENHRRYASIDNIDDDYDYDEPYFYNSDFFLFFEPGVNAELNLLKVVRLYAGLSYRWVTDVFLPNTNVDQLGGFSGNVGLRFGWF